MAVTLSVADVARSLRAVDSPDVSAELTELLNYARAEVLKVAEAPNEIHDMAAAMLVQYLYDRPEASAGEDYVNSARNSGALAVLLPYRKHGKPQRVFTGRGFSDGFSRGFR